MFHVHLRRMYILLLGKMCCICLLVYCVVDILYFLLIFCLVVLFFFLFFFLTFIYFWETERGRAWAGEGQKEREIQNLKQAPGSELFVSPELDAGLELTSCETMTWAEVGRSANWATQVPDGCSFHFWEEVLKSPTVIVACYFTISSLKLMLCY